ncbi:hypothetical protein [Edwardsiella tarda]|uniref:hypothetical protein n=1 Tax=Edwardsiella tarda TaxID=636 RepID=UPI00351CA831
MLITRMIMWVITRVIMLVIMQSRRNQQRREKQQKPRQIRALGQKKRLESGQKHAPDHLIRGRKGVTRTPMIICRPVCRALLIAGVPESGGRR